MTYRNVELNPSFKLEDNIPHLCLGEETSVTFSFHLAIPFISANFVSLQNSHVEIQPLMYLEVGPLGSGRTLMNGISAFMTETLENISAPCTVLRHSKMLPVCEPESKLLLDAEPAKALILEFSPPPQNYETYISVVYNLSSPYGIQLEKPNRTR